MLYLGAMPGIIMLGLALALALPAASARGAASLEWENLTVFHTNQVSS
jgi:hypothetical protein